MNFYFLADLLCCSVAILNTKRPHNWQLCSFDSLDIDINIFEATVRFPWLSMTGYKNAREQAYL